MEGFRLAVKGFIVDDGDLLVLRRREDEAQAPGIWELPGGRLEPGEDPFQGLQREVEEETGLGIEPHRPLSVRHFERDDGQTITMVVFSCTAQERGIDIREEEHTDAAWVRLEDAEERLDPFFHREIGRFRELS